MTVTNMYMQMGAASPLSAVEDLVGGGSCQVFQAPLVHDREDEEGQHPAARNATSGAARSGNDEIILWAAAAVGRQGSATELCSDGGSQIQKFAPQSTVSCKQHSPTAEGSSRRIKHRYRQIPPMFLSADSQLGLLCSHKPFFRANLSIASPLALLQVYFIDCSSWPKSSTDRSITTGVCMAAFQRPGARSSNVFGIAFSADRDAGSGGINAGAASQQQLRSAAAQREPSPFARQQRQVLHAIETHAVAIIATDDAAGKNLACFGPEIPPLFVSAKIDEMWHCRCLSPCKARAEATAALSTGRYAKQVQQSVQACRRISCNALTEPAGRLRSGRWGVFPPFPSFGRKSMPHSTACMIN